jgi:hypothetical protein
MGTRGLMGVRVNGTDKLTYNHLDSYPEGLGADVIKDIKEVYSNKGIYKIFKEKAIKLELVNGDERPTPEQKAELIKHADLVVSGRSSDDWYCLIHGLQGKLADTIASGYMIDYHEFINDSLFCEYAYIANLDEDVLEVYKGFQTKQHSKGRYATSKGEKPYSSCKRDYYPCALVGIIPFSELSLEKLIALFPKEEV